MEVEPAPQRPARGPGLRPTLRQVMILVLTAALIFALALAALPGTRADLINRSFLVALLFAVSIPLLGGLIRLLDRPGPGRRWLSALLFAASLPAVAVVADISMLGRYLVYGQGPGRWAPVIALGFANLVLLRFLFRDLPAFLPRRCACCGRRAVVPRDPNRREDSAPPCVCLACGAESGTEPKPGGSPAQSWPTGI